MLDRTKPAPRIVMCFFSDHSSTAEDFPLPLVHLGAEQPNDCDVSNFLLINKKQLQEIALAAANF